MKGIEIFQAVSSSIIGFLVIIVFILQIIFPNFVSNEWFLICSSLTFFAALVYGLILKSKKE